MNHSERLGEPAEVLRPASDVETWSAESNLEIAALCVGNALGACVGFLVPVWVAALIHERFLSTTKVGWLASAQLILLAGAGIATSVRGGGFNPRRVGVTLAAVSAFATAMAAVHTYATVMAGLFLFAAASGVLHALMIRVGALRPNAPRVLALMTAAAMALGSATTFFSRHAMQHIGVSGLFLMIAVLSVLSGIFMFFCFADSRFSGPITPQTNREVRHTFSFSTPAVLACLAGALVNMAGTTSGAYSLVIGGGLGFGPAAATTALAISEPIALLGPFGALQLGERLGVLGPILAGLAVLTANQFLLVNAPSLQLFSVALIVSGLIFAFYIPYAMALVGRLDPSGRLVGALPGLITIGASVGPALGGTVIASLSFRALAPVAASLYCAAVGLFWLAGRLMAKETSR